MDAILTTLHLAHLPSDFAVHIALCRDLKNASFLRQQLLDGNADFEYAMLDASTILSSTHVLAAVFRAVNDMMHNRMKSRNVHSEIVFALSPNNNIAESFRKFGILDGTRDLLVIKLAMSPDIAPAAISRHLGNTFDGTWDAFDDSSLSQLSDLTKIKKIYKLNVSNPKTVREDKGVNGETEAGTGASEKRELEVAILGLMALRGAS